MKNNNTVLLSFLLQWSKLLPTNSSGISLINFLTQFKRKYETSIALFCPGGGYHIFIQLLRINEKRLPGK